MTCENCFNYEICKRLEKLLHRNIACLAEADIDCEDFEDRSAWVKLPCKVGDILYEPTDRNTIVEYSVKAINVELRATFIEWEIEKGFVLQYLDGICSDEIGKTVFLTREEAERALKERESNDE